MPTWFIKFTKAKRKSKKISQIGPGPRLSGVFFALGLLANKGFLQYNLVCMTMRGGSSQMDQDVKEVYLLGLMEKKIIVVLKNLQ